MEILITWCLHLTLKLFTVKIYIIFFIRGDLKLTSDLKTFHHENLHNFLHSSGLSTAPIKRTVPVVSSPIINMKGWSAMKLGYGGGPPPPPLTAVLPAASVPFSSTSTASLLKYIFNIKLIAMGRSYNSSKILNGTKRPRKAQFLHALRWVISMVKL